MVTGKEKIEEDLTQRRRGIKRREEEEAFNNVS
jgi:hypothetical protein